MRAALVLGLGAALLTIGCPHQETDDEAYRKITAGLPTAQAHQQLPPEPRATAAPPPAKPVEEKPTETPAERCTRTRAARVHEAQRAILAFHTRFKELGPVTKFVEKHKCELRDNTGTVLVTRTKEAGGTRISVKHGAADEIVCKDTTKLPPELTKDVMREVIVYQQTNVDDVMFSTWDECDDTEKPSLRVRYNDGPAQRAILEIKDAP